MKPKVCAEELQWSHDAACPQAGVSRSRSSGRGFRVSRDFVKENPDVDPTATELVLNALLTAALFEANLDGLLRESKLTVGSLNAMEVIAGDPEALGPMSQMVRDCGQRLAPDRVSQWIALFGQDRGKFSVEFDCRNRGR